MRPPLGWWSKWSPEARAARTAHPRLAPRLEYEARNQKKEAKELAFLEAMKQQEAQPKGASQGTF